MVPFFLLPFIHICIGSLNIALLSRVVSNGPDKFSHMVGVQGGGALSRGRGQLKKKKWGIFQSRAGTAEPETQICYAAAALLNQ